MPQQTEYITIIPDYEETISNNEFSLTEDETDSAKFPPQTFYMFPKVLLTHSNYLHISADAKLVFMLLDRFALSIKNQWKDKENHIYIYFTQREITTLLGYKKDKVSKLMNELSQNGFIARNHQGLGKPDRIYIQWTWKTDITAVSSFQASEIQTSTKSTTNILKNRTQDVEKNECNNTNQNKTEFNNTYFEKRESIPETKKVIHTLPDDGNWSYHQKKYMLLMR